ncbi:MAG: hypothetical protein J6V08_01850 [Candidatus Methanomethylophilaceae archaeon]|nr:hypothetical protein [Candidatus Methanomethylophilaceae archaeon]
MKFDTSKIEGYAEMSAEDKVQALEGFEIEVPAPKENDDTEKLRAALTKANSEAAEWKRQFREKQTEQERAEAERVEREKAVEEELRGLRRDKAVSGFLAQCVTLGYDNDLALRAAEAMADGNAAEILACQQEFIEAKTKQIEANALNKQPGLTTGAPPVGAKDKEETNKLRGYFGLPPIS